MSVRVRPIANLAVRFGVVGAVAGVFACGGGGGKYAGHWSRELYGEGAVEMSIGADGSVEVTLPQGDRWGGRTIAGKVSFKGDTLVWGEDSGTFTCKAPGAAYVLTMAEGKLDVDGVGADPCGARHAALTGTWSKKG